MTRNEARDYFENSGLSYSSIKGYDAYRLLSFVQEELSINKDCLDMTVDDVTTDSFAFNTKGELETLFITVSGGYFNGREAIYFNRDGFVGFAGWASSKNVEPFINAFIKWCNWLKNR